MNKVLFHEKQRFSPWWLWLGNPMGRKRNGYNIKGNKGLQLKFKNGKVLLVGTQKPEELQKVLDEIKILK